MGGQSSLLFENLRRVAIWSVAFATVSLASLIGLSRFLEDSEPVVAASVFPLNVEARIGAITNALNSGNGDLSTLEEATLAALHYDAGDARLYSLLGEIHFRRGNGEEAYGLFDRARQLSKTEINALQHTIVRAIQTDQLAKAVRETDILLRRWPDKFVAISSIFPSILAEPEGYDAVLTVLKANAPWRMGLFSALGKDAVGIAVAERLLIDLKRSTAPPRQSELDAIIRGYIAQERYEAAYRLFLFTLSGEEERLGGYIFNGRFAPVRTNRPFDWQVTDGSGVETTFLPSEGSPDGDAGAKIRFLNMPVKGVSLQQYLQLPPGSYVITLNASARNLKLPKGLFWSLACVKPQAELVTLEIPEGSFSNRDLAAKFTIGSHGCTLQRLKLITAAIADSWRYRYVGVLTMHDIRIERTLS